MTQIKLNSALHENPWDSDWVHVSPAVRRFAVPDTRTGRTCGVAKSGTLSADSLAPCGLSRTRAGVAIRRSIS